MCCFITALLLVGPRLGVLVWYIFNPVYVNGAFDNFIWGFLGWLLLPWTTLMYIIVAPGGVVGWDWLWIALGVLLDIMKWSSMVQYRKENEYYPESMP